MTDKPSPLFQNVLDKIEQEKRERPPQKEHVPSVMPKQASLPEARVVPNFMEQAKNAGEMRAKVVHTLGKRCPICQNLTTYRRPHRYHCATCHVFIDLD
jgi:hypothetical protein